MSELLDVLGTQQENSVPGRSIRFFREKAFECSRISEIVSVFEDCEKISIRETRNRVDKNGFIQNEIRVKCEADKNVAVL